MVPQLDFSYNAEKQVSAFAGMLLPAISAVCARKLFSVSYALSYTLKVLACGEPHNFEYCTSGCTSPPESQAVRRQLHTLASVMVLYGWVARVSHCSCGWLL